MENLKYPNNFDQSNSNFYYAPEEPDLSEYIDAALLEEVCKTCKHRISERQAARKHKAQTFKPVV